MEFAIVCCWVFFFIVAGVIASHRGRSGVGFFFLAVLLSPLIGVVAALVASPDVAVLERRALHGGTMKKCPYCSELIKRAAVVCRYCGRDIPVAETKPVNAGVTSVAAPADVTGRSWVNYIWIVVLVIMAIVAVVEWIK